MGKKPYNRTEKAKFEKHITPSPNAEKEEELVGKPWIPSTPGGTPLVHLASATEDEAWAALMDDAVGMPYDSKEAFETRGYTVDKWEMPK